jgi:eukaryotic-like serine/threonine-protein kinase
MEPLTAEDPRQVSVFLLESRLGAGGMGRVYLARSPGGRAVALKVVHPELARDPEFMRRFRREVEAAEAVSGAYTAPVIGAGPDDSPPWLATAYVPGPSLAELVTRMGPLPEPALWRLAGGLTEALQTIHARGLVHRDLKPGNILIAADGPRVIDFGISRALHGVAITAAETTMGTPAYMSPEQAGGKEIGAASDIFSLGSVLAFAAAGAAPFEGGSSLSVIYRIVHDEPDLSRIPPRLAGLVAGCLARDPAARPSPAALMEAIGAGSAASSGGYAPGRFWPDAVSAVIAGQENEAAQARARTGAFAVPAGPAGGGSGGTRVPAGSAPGTGSGSYTHPAAGYQGGQPTGGLTPPGYTPPGFTPPPVTGPPGGQRGSSTSRWLAWIGVAAVAAAGLGATLALVLPGPGPSGTSTPSTSPTAVITPAAVTSPRASGPATSPSATVPASSPAASPSDSLIAVTVCAFPADGCTDPGAAQYMEVRPKEISISGDSTGEVTSLVWSNWGSPRATATGTEELDDCNPNCAQGHDTPYPATVTLAGLTPYGTGLQAYSTIVVRSEAANTTETYTTDTVPRT